MGEGRDKMGNFYLTPSPLHFLSNLMGLKNGEPGKKIARSHNLFSLKPKAKLPSHPQYIFCIFFAPFSILCNFTSSKRNLNSKYCQASGSFFLIVLRTKLILGILTSFSKKKKKKKEKKKKERRRRRRRF